MCRLFGLIANKKVDIYFSMLEASNRFKFQAKDNPHGWGIGWFDEQGKPRVEKYGENALCSERFNELVKEIKSQIFIAHVRFATSGSSHSDKNAHPFIYKNWIFAHNGTIDKEFIERLLIAPYNEDFTSEPIDSEVYFRYIIQCIEQKGNITEGIKKAVNEAIKGAKGANFLLSDGKKLYAFKYRKNLYLLFRYPTDSFHGLSKETGALIEAKKLAKEKAVLIATEKITKDENWETLSDGELVVIDKNLKIEKENLLIKK